MDINDLRKIFGGMPIESLNAAQILQNKKNRNILIGGIAIGAFILGAYAMHEYYKFKDKSKNKVSFL